MVEAQKPVTLCYHLPSDRAFYQVQISQIERDEVVHSITIDARSHSDSFAKVSLGSKAWMAELVSLFRVYSEQDTIPGLVNNYLFNDRLAVKTIEVANLRFQTSATFEL